MLTGIIKATRAHYAALQHRPGDGRVPIYCHVGHNPVYALYVKVSTERTRRAALTRTLNMLRSMWPECEIEVSYRE